MARNAHPEETVAKILDVSLELFFTKGYDQTSIQDIIDNLGGLTKGAVYHHFKSKEEILSAALDRDNESLFAELKRIRDDGKMTGLEKLQTLFETSINGPQLEIWASIAPSTDPVKNSRLLGLEYKAIFEETVPYYVQPIIEQGVRDGSIKTEQPKELAEVLVLLANLWAGPMFRASNPDEMQKRIDFYVAMARALGADVSLNGMNEALERYRSTFVENLQSHEFEEASPSVEP